MVRKPRRNCTNQHVFVDATSTLTTTKYNQLPPLSKQPTIGGIAETDGSIRSNEQVLDPWDYRYNWTEFATLAFESKLRQVTQNICISV